MTSPATQEPCQRRREEHDNGCPAAKDMPRGLWVCTCAPPSQRAELLTQEQLRVHKACVEVINHAPFRQDISELINAARALSDAYAALTQRVEAIGRAVEIARKRGALALEIDVAMEAALSQEPRNG